MATTAVLTPDKNENSIIVFIQRSRHKMPLPTTMGVLQEEIEKIANIPPQCQSLLIKGSRVKNFNQEDSPLSVGIKPNTKLMVMKVSPEHSNEQKEIDVSTVDQTSPQMITLRHCRESITKLCHRLRKEIVPHINLRSGEIHSEQKSLKEIEEGCMRVLEALDGIVIGVINESNTEEKNVWKKERKSLVTEGQQLLNEVDTANESLKEWEKGLQEDKQLPIAR